MEKRSENNAPIFLAGVYRSGTTLLRLMLNAHARIAIPVESHFLTELIYRYPPDQELSQQQVNEIGEFICQHSRFQHWETTPQSLSEKLHDQGSLNLADLISLIYQLEVSSTNKPRWGDKTPGYERHFDQLAAVFPQAKFIHIHRDGRDVSNSMCDRSWHGITEFQRARYWRHSIEKAMSSSNQLGAQRCLSIAYEELVTHPEATLRRVCIFLGEEYMPEMLQFSRDADQQIVDQAIHTKLARMPDPEKDLQRWKRESSKIRVLLFEAMAGKALEACGYKLQFGPTSRVLAKTCYWLPGTILSRFHQAYLAIPAEFRGGLRRNRLINLLRGKLYNREQNRAGTQKA